MAKPEAQFISNLHSRLGKDKFGAGDDIHKQSMYTPYSGGTPDNYYEALNISLWVEYKFERKMPKIYRLTQKLSPLQLKWINRAYDNGQNVAVVVGFGKTDVAIFQDLAWTTDYTEEELEPYLITRDEYVQSLISFMRGDSINLGGVL